ncbi:MAG: sodium-dependent transporter [Desulfurococcaceae archaeon]
MSSLRRETWTSGVGLALSLIGVAVGLGNVWRFPYMLGRFGGAGFLVVYVLLVIGVGIPGLIVELAIARYAGRGPFSAFTKIGYPGGRIVGYTLLVTVIAAVAYYIVVIGWVLWYLILSVTGAIFVERVDFSAAFSELTSSLHIQLAMHVAIVALCILVVSSGVRRGVELASKLLMPVVYAILVGIAVYVLGMPKALEGLVFYLKPAWEKVTGFTVLAAMGQVFFSLGLGSTWIFIYGSYMSKDQKVVRSALYAATGDTVASFIAGLAVLPLVFIFGVDPQSGPPLMFITLPEIFRHLPGGAVLFTLFFAALLFAALLSAVPGFEIFVDAMSEFGLSRGRAVPIMGLVEVLLGVPSMLSVDILLYNDLFWGTTMLPVASLFSITAFGWLIDRKTLIGELELRRETLPWKALYYWVKVVMPVLVVAVLVYGWISWFS